MENFVRFLTYFTKVHGRSSQNQTNNIQFSVLIKTLQIVSVRSVVRIHTATLFEEFKNTMCSACGYVDIPCNFLKWQVHPNALVYNSPPQIARIGFLPTRLS